MTWRVALYRLYRLRRLIAIAAGVPMILLTFLAAFGATWLLAFAPLVAGLPLAHALRYPHEWQETLALSAASTAATYVLAIGTAIFGPWGLVVLVPLSGGGALVLFAWLLGAIPGWLEEGTRDHTVTRAHMLSRRPIEALQSRILMRPGLVSGPVRCGPAEEDGSFEVRLVHPPTTLGGHRLQAQPETFRVKDVPPEPLDGTDRPEEWHEVRALDEQGREVSALRTRLRRTLFGTMVTLEETSEPMTRAQALGIWLRDPLADELTEMLDRAAERPTLSHRFVMQGGLLDEIERRVAAAGTAKAEAKGGAALPADDLNDETQALLDAVEQRMSAAAR